MMPFTTWNPEPSDIRGLIIVAICEELASKLPRYVSLICNYYTISVGHIEIIAEPGFILIDTNEFSDEIQPVKLFEYYYPDLLPKLIIYVKKKLRERNIKERRLKHRRSKWIIQ